MNITTAMSALLLSILGLSVGMPDCPMWKTIAPCTCRLGSPHLMSVSCEKMSSYGQVVGLLRGHFTPEDRVSLGISFSTLDDLHERTFAEFNMTIENLRLNFNNLRFLNQSTFEGLSSVTYLNLADNALGKVPDYLWKEMPNIKTLDLGRTGIMRLTDNSFRDLKYLQTLVLPGNLISYMEKNSIPPVVNRLHMGRNYIRTLNGTLLHLNQLSWLFVNANELSDLDNELPVDAPNLKMLHFSNNSLRKLPEHLKTYTSLDSLFAQHNYITGLDGTFTKGRNLLRLVLDNNLIDTIRRDEFEECEMLESLMLSHNRITTFNNSLLNLKKLNFVNVSYNLMEEFSFHEIFGLEELRSIDLSFNRIKKVIGPAANLVEWNIKLSEIKLDNNEIEHLNGALSGLPELLRLNLSYNRLTHLSPDDLIGLDQLRLLDISHNRITTLEETSKTFLPRLEELRASHNHLIILDKDFHGLPVLCYADMAHNRIVALGRELVSKTRCKIGHGVHEGTWGILKIDMNGNPLLCDSALSEISTIMEANHTRIFGISHCGPLSEQPVTSRPGRFLGYIPESTPPSPPPSSIAEHIYETHSQQIANNENQVSPLFVPPAIHRQPDHLEFRTVDLSNRRTLVEHHHQSLEPGGENSSEDAMEDVKQIKRANATYTSQSEVLRQDDEASPDRQVGENVTVANFTTEPASSSESVQEEQMQNDQALISAVVIDPVAQERQLSKMASEIEMLRSQIEQLAEQNRMLLNQQKVLNKVEKATEQRFD